MTKTRSASGQSTPHLLAVNTSIDTLLPLLKGAPKLLAQKLPTLATDAVNQSNAGLLALAKGRKAPDFTKLIELRETVKLPPSFLTNPKSPILDEGAFDAALAAFEMLQNSTQTTLDTSMSLVPVIKKNPSFRRLFTEQSWTLGGRIYLESVPRIFDSNPQDRCPELFSHLLWVGYTTSLPHLARVILAYFAKATVPDAQSILFPDCGMIPTAAVDSYVFASTLVAADFMNNLASEE